MISGFLTSPLLKDDKAAGVADVDATKERGRQQAVDFHFGDNFAGGCEGDEGYLMEGECADLHVLSRQWGKDALGAVWALVAYGRGNGESAGYVLPAL